jgi:transcription antitermination factor NusG
MPEMTMTDDKSKWYAIRVRSRCEKLAAAGLASRNVEVLSAVTAQRRVWIDRVRTVEMPLFPGYIFARFLASRRMEVERTAGIASIVQFSNECCAVDDEEINAIRVLLGSGLEVQRAPFLGVGKKVAVKHGPLAGARGIISEIKNRYRLVVSVSLLQRSVGVEIDEAMVEPLWMPTESFPAVRVA